MSKSIVRGGESASLSRQLDRPDRLIGIKGRRVEEWASEYSTDDGKTWHPATIYRGETIDEWRTCNYAAWNKGTTQGIIPRGSQTCLWNYFFDLEMSADRALLRISRANELVIEQEVDLREVGDVFVIDRRNCAALSDGRLPAPWKLKLGGKKEPAKESITCAVDDPLAPPLVLEPGLEGWHRIYVGMESFSPCRVSLSREQIWYAVPDYQQPPNKRGRNRFLREYYLKSADLTGQDLCLALGGTVPTWHDVSVRHVRFVPMTADDIADFSGDL